MIVLLPGYGVGQRHLDPLAGELGGELLRPGYGEPAPIGELAARVASRFDAPAVVVGDSMGAQVAAALAAERPELVDALVLVGPTVDPRARSLVRQALRLGRDAWYEPLRLTAVTLSEYTRHGSVAQARYALADRIEERLPGIEAPAVVVRGAHDPICPAEWAREVAALLPRGRLVTVAGAGHAVHWSHPREVAAAVARVEKT